MFPAGTEIDPKGEAALIGDNLSEVSFRESEVAQRVFWEKFLTIVRIRPYRCEDCRPAIPRVRAITLKRSLW
jgi:hypothetical protein